jgi:hypothetical protein
MMKFEICTHRRERPWKRANQTIKALAKLPIREGILGTFTPKPLRSTASLWEPRRARCRDASGFPVNQQQVRTLAIPQPNDTPLHC